VTAASTSFRLINGARADNVIWALGTAATLGANSVLEGSILAGSAITVGTNAQIHGCALAQTAVTFETAGRPPLLHWTTLFGDTAPAAPQGPLRGPRGARGLVGAAGVEPGSIWFQSQMNPSLASFNPALCPDGDNGMVRLAQCTRRACKLEVLHVGHWGSVCDDGFGGENARVVCQSLGYSGHRAAALRQLTGGNGRIWLDDVKCKGNEDSITLCKHNGWGAHDCTHQKDVGVCCQRGGRRKERK
ncbi:SRCR-like domain-containing protein, partial [Baffinella frigidus]